MRMFRTTLITGCLTLAGLAPAQAEDMHLLLELQRTTGDDVTDTVSLWGSDIDPNSRSVDDRYKLVVNGKTVDAPDALLAKLDVARRGYSYDNFTGGIATSQTPVVCAMAGPSEGQHLMTRYLTYEESKIVSSEMRTVLSEPLNCLYTDRTAPKESAALVDATRALGGLSVLLDMHLR